MGKKLDLATIVGVVAGLGLIIAAVLMGGGAGMFVNLPALLIVIGGTMAATLISFPLHDVLRVIKVAPRTFRLSYSEPVKITEQVLGLYKHVEKEGMAALGDQARNLNNPFFRSAVDMVVDGVSPEQVVATLRLENLSLYERHTTCRKVLESLGTWAPAVGLIGSLIGLAQMMANLADPAAIGPHMAVALLTTLYGAALAHMLFLPMARRLKRLTEIELVTNQIITEGIAGIQRGAAPTTLERTLNNVVEAVQQDRAPAGRRAGARA